ncbi:MAG TPA: AtpZ/AtpI family protein [Methylomirabilota bacterium]
MVFRPGRQRGEAIRTIGAVSAAGFAFVLAVLMGAGAGYLLDGWLGTSPWLFLLGFFLGLAAGIRNVFRAAGVWGGAGRQ